MASRVASIMAPIQRILLPRRSYACGGSVTAGGVVLSGLVRSARFVLAVQVYLRHAVDSAGRCPVCVGMPCRPRIHAAKIIEAAGVDPREVYPMRGWCGLRVSPQLHHPRCPSPGTRAGRVGRRPATMSVARRGRTPSRRTGTSVTGCVGLPPGTYAIGRMGVGLGRSCLWCSMRTGDRMPIGAAEHARDPWTLRGLLVCGLCGRPCYPLQLPGGPRAYRRSCGCGLLPIVATGVEEAVDRVVRDERPALVEGVAAALLAAAYRRALSAVRVDATGLHPQLVWRT
jgi:hypothetical protein